MQVACQIDGMHSLIAFAPLCALIALLVRLRQLADVATFLDSSESSVVQRLLGSPHACSVTYCWPGPIIGLPGLDNGEMLTNSLML